ncbi:DUF2057 family protein [Colwellia sp. 4_MG-2023]|uniref:DUF2057 family protein n=1 Tax=unclassified Colwellia TaxID=196834 RepID=UPI001C08C721|nr:MULTISPECIES: DUF2057 family protein [unclassified Colwellia]MBU2923413.1 DUF2057 domain-containing protein [Colwellia sp. C2M11]MDO6486952.1 DUF2057 family protein [Colwellia sp. 6_MG-2023]MDO6508038.1 DUF2057 family protein [Colwellia sp. 5_MG-2023]MDO6556781.1 DUF2057 family protein [Colwellia sp. 4_MG-2023]MDO6653773.1 DUF2057 family protein [Colwellia sp. 3_MG-2023]
MARLLNTISCVLFTSMVSMTLSAATLTVADNLIVTEIDNKAVEHGLLSKKSTFELNSGNYALIMHYKDVFEDLDFAENRVVKSKDFVVKLAVKEESNLNLDTVAIKNLAQAESFSQSPELILKDEKNKRINITLETLENYKMAQQVNLAVNTYVAKQTMQKKTVSSLEKNVAVTQSSTSLNDKVTVVQDSGNTLIQVDALTMLKYWWQNASNEERNHFTQYMTSKK